MFMEANRAKAIQVVAFSRKHRPCWLVRVTKALQMCRVGFSVFLFFDRQWFPVRRWLRTDYAVFDARDARVGRPGLTALVPKSFHIARPVVIVQQNEHPVSRCGADVPPFAHGVGPSFDSL